MKSICYPVFAVFLLFCTFSAQAAAVRVNTEEHPNQRHQGKGVAVIIDEVKIGSEQLVFYGLSANTLKSDQPLQSSDKNKIYPLHAFVNYSFDYAISPYIEFGMDLGDWIIDEIFDGKGENIDIYYSLGVELRLKKTVAVALYHKVYDLRFSEKNNSGSQNAMISLTGISLTYYMK